MRSNKTNLGSVIPLDNASPKPSNISSRRRMRLIRLHGLAELPLEQAKERILALDLPRRAKTFSYLSFDIQAEFV